MSSTDHVEKTENMEGVNLKHQYRNMDLEKLKASLDDPTISKNQKKKIMKQIMWIESAPSRRDRRKEKKKERALNKKKLFEDHEKDSSVELPSKPKKPRKEKISTQKDFLKHVHVAVDLSFDEYMTNQDLSKLRKQIGWCYQENRRCIKPVQYHICGLSKRMKEGMDQSYKNWDVHFDATISEQFKKEDMVYLTAESDDVITKFDPGKVYVIGGLVDHNRHKGLTHTIARRKGLETRRLPLEEYLDMKTRKVLTVNHVFSIIIAYCELQNWKEALMRSIPVRKRATLLDQTNEEESKP